MALFSHLNTFGIYFTVRNKEGLQLYVFSPPFSLFVFSQFINP